MKYYIDLAKAIAFIVACIGLFWPICFAASTVLFMVSFVGEKFMGRNENGKI